MAPKRSSKTDSKASYQEKGKRKVDDVSPKLETPRIRRRGPGIEIREERAERAESREESRGFQTPYQSRQIRSKNVSGRFGVSSSNPFKNESDEQKFIEKIAARNVVRGKYLDFQFFSSSEFICQKWMIEFGLYDYLCSPLSIYQDLVRFFYFYLKRNDNGVYTSYIKGIEISFTAREFAEIMRLPYVDLEESTSVNISDAIFDLTADVDLSTLKTSFAARELASVEFKILFAVVCNSLYPRGGGYDMVNLEDVSLMWCVVFNKPYSLVESMLRYMVNQRDRLNGNLPYAMFLTRLFKHFGIDLRKEGVTEPTSYDLIGEATLKRMKYRKDEEGVWVHSPPYGSESKAKRDTGSTGKLDEAPGSEQKESVNEEFGKSSSPSPTPKPHTSQPTTKITVDFEPMNIFLQSQFKLLHEHISAVDQRLVSVEEFIKTLTPKATDQIPSPVTEPKSQPATQPQPQTQPPSSSPTVEADEPTPPEPVQPSAQPSSTSPAQPTVKAYRKKSVSKPKKLPPKRKLSLRPKKLKVKSGSRFDLVSSEEDQPMSPRRGSSDYSD